MPATRFTAQVARHLVSRRATARAISCVAGATLVLALVAPPRAGAQSAPYANTATGRPMRIEDATPIPRYALDVYLAPVRASLLPGGAEFSARLGLAYGLLPRTQVEIALPVVLPGAAGGQRFALAGVDLAAQYTFNAETRSLPSVALAGGILVPVASTRPARAHPSLKALVTRTFDWGRLHANAAATFGREPASGDSGGMRLLAGRGDALDAADLSRWMAGAAVDRAFPGRAILLGVEAYASQSMGTGAAARWHAGAALRYQLFTRTTLDASVSRTLSGPGQAWFASLGIGRRVALRSLTPGRGAWKGP